MYWYNCRKYIYQALICVNLLACANAVFADSGDKFDSKDRSLTEAEVPKAKVRAKPFTGFARFKRSFDSICELLKLDGRVEAYHTMLDKNSLRDDACPACRPLITSFTASCRKHMKKPRVAAVRKKEGEEEEGKPPPPETIRQRDPATELINEVSKLFIAFSEDVKIREQVLPAAEKVISLLREPAGKTPGEADYFQTIAEFMEAPFLELKAQHKQQTETKEEPHKFEQAEPAVDEMFDF